jgi:hypothetical protein
MPQNGEELLDLDSDVSGETDDIEVSGEAPDTSDQGSDTDTPETAADGSQLPRDEAGRFTSRDAKRDLLSTDVDTADAAPDTTTDRVAAGTTDTPAASTPGAPAPEEGGTPQEYEQAPWSVSANNEEHAIEGAVYVKGHGVLIPETKMEDVGRLVSRGLMYQKQWREIREMQETLKAQASAPAAEVVEAKLLLTELKPLMDPQNAEAFADFMADPTGNLSRMLDRVEKQMLADENARLKQGLNAGREEVQQIESQEQMATVFSSAFDRIANHPHFRGKLPEGEVKAAYQKLQKYHPRFFRNAETDMPEYGVQKGDLIIEQQVIIDELSDRLALIERMEAEKKRIAAEQERLNKIAKDNDRRLGATSGKKPRVPVARTSTGDVTPPTQKRLTARDAKRDLLDTELDE